MGLIIAGLTAVGQPCAAAAGGGGANGALAAADDGSREAGGSLASQGRTKFLQRRFDEAIDLFRRHLRRFPKDANVWNELGAAYYHTGQPRKALRYLKHVERNATDHSYNLYYQGLCYLAAEEPDRAKEYFSAVATRYKDEYAARSTVELGIMEYNEHNKPRAFYWLTLYLQRYGNGTYAARAQQLVQSLRENRWIDGVEGTRKPDMEDALFKYNKLSFGPKPHYWFVQGGGQLSQDSGQEPDQNGGIKPSSAQSISGLANAGIGIGPWKQGDTTALAGYSYRQNWLTDQDRIDEWSDSFTDLRYFPLRGDLLERHHQIYGDFRHDVAGYLYYGVYGRYEWIRINSKYFPTGENSQLAQVLKVADTQLLIPWIGTSYFNNNFRTLAYIYLRKELNSDSPDYSNKSYNFADSKRTPLSFGLSHNMDFPDLGLTVNVELYQYQFTYNDYWLDYQRTGGFLGTEIEVMPRWYLTGLVGYYSDDYVLPRIKERPCGTQPTVGSNDGSALGGTPNTCSRVDTGLMYQLGLYWNWTQFQRFSFYVQMVENKNPSQKEFEDSKVAYQFMYTMAFPSVKRVVRIIDRYADTAFTKGAP